ncbi:MAG TPA: short-chain dehydrogenase/reductase [Capillimicrobium sp.]|jgi:NAD(P)-dependent dehydrogenase (short-subunit alcohol dehydrogenase family)
MSYSVQGRTVLVTGAARGIGAGVARALAARGAKLSLVGLEPELLAQLAAELGPDAAWFEADVTDRAALDAAVAGTVERFGGIDVVIANAGVAPVGTVATLPREAFVKTLDVNLTGVYDTIHAALPHVVERKGYILPIASGAAVMHLPMMAPYAASKAAVEAFADCLRVELRPKGTAVGCAYFLFIDTDMVRQADRHPATQRSKVTIGTAPLSAAVDAIVDGIERRARVVYAPRALGPMMVLRGIINPLANRLAPRRRDVRDAIRLAEEQPQAPGSGPMAPDAAAGGG